LDDETIKWISLAVLSILTAFFSVAEALLSRLSREEILNVAEEGGKRYELLTSLLRDTRRYSVTIVTAKSGLIVAIVMLLTSLDYFGSPRSRILAGFLAMVILVVVTELIPKNYIRGSSENSTIQTLRALRVIYWMLFPIVKPLSLLGSIGVRVLGGTVEPEQDSVASPEVLETLDKVGDSQEILEDDEREMISRIFDLPDKVAREIMIPRTDSMVCLEVSTPKEDVLETAIESRHSRIPVYEESIDNIIGILHVKDLLDYWADGKPIDLRELIDERTPFFTPESKKIWDLFQDLRANKQHMAIVVDEYGGTAGLITLEDIIEEVVGEIHDEYDFDEQDECIQLDKNAYSVDARMNLADLNERIRTQIASDSVDTIGGFVVDYLGRVPERQSQFFYQNLEFTILEADERRIHRIRIQISDVVNGQSAQI
jgi:putative hemolysin